MKGEVSFILSWGNPRRRFAKSKGQGYVCVCLNELRAPHRAVFVYLSLWAALDCRTLHELSKVCRGEAHAFDFAQPKSRGWCMPVRCVFLAKVSARISCLDQLLPLGCALWGTKSRDRVAGH